MMGGCGPSPSNGSGTDTRCSSSTQPRVVSYGAAVLTGIKPWLRVHAVSGGRIGSEFTVVASIGSTVFRVTEHTIHQEESVHREIMRCPQSVRSTAMGLWWPARTTTPSAWSKSPRSMWRRSTRNSWRATTRHQSLGIRKAIGSARSRYRQGSGGCMIGPRTPRFRGTSPGSGHTSSRPTEILTGHQFFLPGRSRAQCGSGHPIEVSCVPWRLLLP
jgi:hypothetical protein